MSGGGTAGSSLPAFGALVISLDFELHWGVRDHRAADGPYRGNLLGARTAIPRMLELFAEFDVAATWATVGLLFARSRRERDELMPRLVPRYDDAVLYPFDEAVGEDEEDDPLHYASSLIRQVEATPRQEIATHTFSHYYCVEPGQDAHMFRADLEAASEAARRQGVRLRSIVFPRNQHNPEYDTILRELGIEAFRGNQSWLYRSQRTRSRGLMRRLLWTLDTYAPVSGWPTISWEAVRASGTPRNVPASAFLRPYRPALRAFERFRHRRISFLLRRAATRHELVHLWWHPHNFGANTDENLGVLRRLLEEFARLRATHGMQSCTMADVAALTRGGA